jgi:O-antigen/teichoic acid export membrane protein
MKPEQEAKFRKKLISGAKWATVIRIASQTFSWAVTLVMVRLLSPQDYGLNAMIEVPVEALMLFSTLGIDAAIIHFGTRDNKQLAATFGLLLLVNVGLSVGLFMSADQIAAYFHEPRLAILLEVVSVLFVLSPFRTIPNALLDMSLDFKLKSQVELAASIISSTVALGLAIGGFGVWALVAALLLNAILKASLLAYIRPWVIRPSFRFGLVRGLLRYGLVISVGGLISMAAAKAVSLIAGPQLGAEVLGFYAVVLVFSQLPMSKIMPILQQTMYPAFARLKEHPDMAKKYLLKYLQMSALVIFPMNIGMACVAQSLVIVIFGEKWAIISLPLAIVSALSPFRLISQIFYGPLNAIGHARLVSWLQVISLVILSGGAITAAQYGLMGLVYLSSVTVAISSAVSVYFGTRNFKITWVEFVISLWPAICSSLVMSGVLIFLKLTTTGATEFIQLTAGVVAGACTYIFAVWLLFRSNFDEIWNTLRPSKTISSDFSH